MRDEYIYDRLPAEKSQPDYLFDLPELQWPEKYNCVHDLLDSQISAGHAEKAAVQGEHFSWSYAELNNKVNQISNLLVNQYGLMPGNRVLLRSPNNPMLAACWLAVVKTGCIAVTTMPLLRALDLAPIVTKAKVDFVICDKRLQAELDELRNDVALPKILFFDAEAGNAELNIEMQAQPTVFLACDTHADDVALIAFTSGTTGNPKGCVHFHRDVISMAICFSKHILKPNGNDVFIGSPPLAFTFGLGALLVFPLYAGATVCLLENGSPKNLGDAIEKFKATICFTSPTGYRGMMSFVPAKKLTSLKKCVSAGEALTKATSDQWYDYTGVRLIDGIGATELIHIFISASGSQIKAGSTGKVLPGYQACIVDKDMKPVAVNEPGYLVVKGPTGCRYLDDARQENYVKNGWNITGDIFSQDADGYFWFKGRSDDMIVSSGYNISAVEVEDALLLHPEVLECAVIGVADAKRGQVVKAHVVLKQGVQANEMQQDSLKDFVKSKIAPYKYPRLVEFCEALPKTQTGKIQRFRLS